MKQTTYDKLLKELRKLESRLQEAHGLPFGTIALTHFLGANTYHVHFVFVTSKTEYAPTELLFTFDDEQADTGFNWIKDMCKSFYDGIKTEVSP